MDLLGLLRWVINGALDLFLHGVYSGLASLLGFYLTWWGIYDFCISRWLRCYTHHIYAHGTRALHAEAFVVSGLVCFCLGALVVGQTLGALLGGRWNG